MLTSTPSPRVSPMNTLGERVRLVLSRLVERGAHHHDDPLDSTPNGFIAHFFSDTRWLGLFP